MQPLLISLLPTESRTHAHAPLHSLPLRLRRSTRPTRPRWWRSTPSTRASTTPQKKPWSCSTARAALGRSAQATEPPSSVIRANLKRTRNPGPRPQHPSGKRALQCQVNAQACLKPLGLRLKIRLSSSTGCRPGVQCQFKDQSPAPPRGHLPSKSCLRDASQARRECRNSRASARAAASRTAAGSQRLLLSLLGTQLAARYDRDPRAPPTPPATSATPAYYLRPHLPHRPLTPPTPEVTVCPHGGAHTVTALTGMITQRSGG